MKITQATATLKKTYHHTFEIKKKGKTVFRHTLLLNPQNLSQNEPSRSSVTYTMGGAYVVDFGSGLPDIVISGTTGYSLRVNDDREARDGFEEFIHFRQLYRNYVETNDPDYIMLWYNWEDEEYYTIQPKYFRLQRSVSEPNLYRYELSFTGLARADKTPSQGYTFDSVDFSSIGKAMLSAISNISEVLQYFSS